MKKITVKDLMVTHDAVGSSTARFSKTSLQEVGNRFAVQTPDLVWVYYRKVAGYRVYIDRESSYTPVWGRTISVNVGSGVDISTALRSAKRTIVREYNAYYAKKAEEGA